MAKFNDKISSLISSQLPDFVVDDHDAAQTAKYQISKSGIFSSRGVKACAVLFHLIGRSPAPKGEERSDTHCESKCRLVFFVSLSCHFSRRYGSFVLHHLLISEIFNTRPWAI